MQLESLKRIAASPYTVAVVFFLFFIALYLHFYMKAATSQIEMADQSYLKGERSQTVAERKTEFNNALESYLKLEEKYDPQHGNGKLYYNIGNAYFQLQEYPMAILYYYKALNLSPNTSRIEHNLNIALSKLDLKPIPKTSTLQNLFFFYNRLSLPARFQIFFFLALIAIAAFSIYLWTALSRFKLIGFCFTGLASLMLLGFIYGYFFEYPQGVVVKSTFLSRGAGPFFSKVVDEPLRAGNKVVIYQSEEEGHWLKIEDAKGNMGYVPYESVRFIF
jgi:tetratricopeptide (TPR) repeat protein